MSPTIPNNINPEKRPMPGRTGAGERRSELLCRVKYCNTLPQIPFDTKFITYPFESTRFIQYNPTSLERNYKYEVLTEHDLGVSIDLINKDQYMPDPNAVLDIADEKLLEEDILTPHDSRRSRHHNRNVSWLRRTEYISTEQTRFQPQVMDKVEAKVGYSIKKSLKEETLFLDRDSQIKAIEKTFDDSKKPIEHHYSKPNVTPVEVLSVFPDFKMWKYPCAQVIFDSDPAPVGRPFPAQLEEMSQAMIRGVMDESGEQFVAYFLPTSATLERRRQDFTEGIDYTEDESYEYKIAREYNWNVKTKASKGYEENYFLVIRQDGVYFNELETRVRLTKRRQKVGQQSNNTRLVVKHRPMDAAEFNIHRTRERQLEPPIEEEDEEEEEDEPDSDNKEENKEDGKESSEDEEDKSDSEDVRKKRKGSDGDSDDKSDKSGDEEENRSESGAREENKSDKSDDEASGSEKSTRQSEEENKSGSESDENISEKSGGDGKSDEERSEHSDDDNKSGGNRSEDERKSERSGAENSDEEGSNPSEGGKSDDEGGKSDDGASSEGGKSDKSSSSSSSPSDSE